MKIDNSKLAKDFHSFRRLVEEKAGTDVFKKDLYEQIGVNKMLMFRVIKLGQNTSLKTLKKISKAIGTKPEDYIINNEE
jgi:hypothetical protein